MLGGGVSANSLLRKTLKQQVKEELPGVQCLVPELKYCIDNGAMVACAGYFHAIRKDFDDWKKLQANANLKLK
jgi:N6-L-threonylcarbamoyladenine synthase